MLNISHCQINYEELNKLASQNNCIGTESEVWTVETLNEQIQTKIECGTKIVDAERAFEDQWHTKIELGMASLSVCGEDFQKLTHSSNFRQTFYLVNAALIFYLFV